MKYKQYPKLANYSKPLINHNQQKLKVKSKEKRDAKIISARIIEEETEELGEKPLRCPPSDKGSIRKSVEIHE